MAASPRLRVPPTGGALPGCTPGTAIHVRDWQHKADTRDWLSARSAFADRMIAFGSLAR